MKFAILIDIQGIMLKILALSKMLSRAQHDNYDSTWLITKHSRKFTLCEKENFFCRVYKFLYDSRVETFRILNQLLSKNCFLTTYAFF